jgi:fibronectin-binding autotransporter adhesin
MGGVLSIANIASSGSPSAIGASSDDAANLVIGNGGELLYTGGLVTTTRGLDLGPGTGIISGPITFLGTVGDNLLGDGNLEKAGPDKLTLAGPVTYTGTTAIDAGVLQIDTAGAVTLSTITGAGTLGIGSGTTLTATSINVGTLIIGAEAPASAATAVPEPGTLVLLALAGMGALLAAWRRK